MDNMKLYTLYTHKSPSGKYYVGITGKPVQKRWGKEGYNYKIQKKFYRAIQKYGWDNFEHTIVLTGLTLEEAYQKECEYIKKYDSKNNGYNSDDGGSGATGHKVSDETRKVMSQLKKGSHPKILHPAGPKVYIYLYTLDEECLGKFLGYDAVCELLDASRSAMINACNYGKLYNGKYLLIKETDLDQLAYRIERAKDRLYAPKIFQYTLDGTFINSYATYREASEATNISIGDIGKCCSGIILAKDTYIFLRKGLSETIEERIDLYKNRLDYIRTNKYKKNKYVIKQFSLYTNEQLAVFNSYQEAALITGISYKKIVANCNNKLKKINEYYFVREDK